MNKALELDPKNATLLFNAAQSCILARRYADADRAYGLAIALTPQWGEPYEEERMAQVEWHGDVSKARAVLDEAGRVTELTDDRFGLPHVVMRGNRHTRSP